MIISLRWPIEAVGFGRGFQRTPALGANAGHGVEEQAVPAHEREAALTVSLLDVSRHPRKHLLFRPSRPVAVADRTDVVAREAVDRLGKALVGGLVEVLAERVFPGQLRARSSLPVVELIEVGQLIRTAYTQILVVDVGRRARLELAPCRKGISESIRPRSLKGPPARRNPVLEPAANGAHATYVNFAPQRTPAGARFGAGWW